jgi:hypothetical protein
VFVIDEPKLSLSDRLKTEQQKNPLSLILFFISQKPNVEFAVNTRVARFFLVQYSKTGKNIPNDHKINPKAIKYTKWLSNIPNGKKYTNIFHSKALRNTPNLGFLGFKIFHLANPWVDIMITIFGNFRQFSAKKLAFFSQTNVMIKILHNLGFVLSQKRQFFRRIFRQKYLKNHNIGPWSKPRQFDTQLKRHFAAQQARLIFTSGSDPAKSIMFQLIDQREPRGDLGQEGGGMVSQY